MAHATDRVIYAAIAANLCIAAAKFTAAAITGSSAMLSEGIHSLVDTGDGVLLAVGIRRSRRPPDVAHPFGHGQERYFWAAVVAMMIFAVGGGMSVYEGIVHLVHPSPVEDLVWTWSVLGLAFLFEGASWVLALRAFSAERGDRSFWQAIREEKDPMGFVVLLEDSAALIGILIAGAGLAVGAATGSAWPDGVASILIGLLLIAVALVLARETRSLLVGEAASPEVVAAIRRLAQADADVARVVGLQTMHLGPEEVLVGLGLRLRPGIEGDEVGAVIDRVEQAIQHAHPQVRWVFIEVD